MLSTNVEVRVMKPAEVGLIYQWADGEGWNPGVHDGTAFYAADPDGFFIATLANEPVACLSCVRYGEKWGFLGQYSVRPDCRGRGFGMAIWSKGMEHLSGRNVGLDGVLTQTANYERSGFRFAYRTSRFEGRGGGERPSGLIELNDVSFAELLRYDAECFFTERERFLRGWVALPESVGLASVVDGALAGYGVLRKSSNGYKVGPLFANNVDIATTILTGLRAAIPESVYCVDVPDTTVQPHGTELVQRLNLSEVFRTARMYTDGVPQFAQAKVFGTTSLELG
jgi:GNAT superfamily N-acetyltransferase